ncbi:hypothetical protein P7F88_22425 [Vibrio hannami]|uniref:hypothetical protein n=1 Tax=Vibrio hannami TaxID=2717094 RepID=UPI00240F08D3|nr:hypothetical protein [Vibrio hannami]MDG3088667.1 hypothetical protein [Vibrio hannami]
MSINGLKLLFVSILLTSVTACSSAPRIVEASLPLVTEQNNFDGADLLPQNYWPLLDDDSSQTLSHEQYQIKIGSKYTSAMGLECRPLYISHELTTRTRITCAQIHKDNRGKSIKAWYLTRNILQDPQEVEL